MQQATHAQVSPEQLEAVGVYVDRLVTMDLRTRLRQLDLYEAASAAQGGAPLCMTAAQAIKEAVTPGKLNTALFITGFYSPAFWCGEQDGPVGSALLARVLETGLGIRSVMVTDDELVDLVAQTCRGAGFKIFDMERALTVPKGRGTSVLGFPKDDTEAQEAASTLLDRLDPACVIAIERPSMNEKGEYHNLRGLNMTPFAARTDYLVVEAKRRGIPTIAVGDGGNELGYGLIAEAVTKVRPNNGKCLCPCEGTVASSVAADIVVHSTISDWGAMGIAACLATLLNDADALLSDDTLLTTLRECTGAEGDDGRYGWVDMGSDGISWRIELGVLRMLRTMAEEAIRLTDPRRQSLYGAGDTTGLQG